MGLTPCTRLAASSQVRMLGCEGLKGCSFHTRTMLPCPWNSPEAQYCNQGRLMAHPMGMPSHRATCPLCRAVSQQRNQGPLDTVLCIHARYLNCCFIPANAACSVTAAQPGQAGRDPGYG